MTLNKYNEYMSHIEVTDEMKARVLANVSKAIEDQAKNGELKASVTPMPAKKHISIVPLISIAATVIIVGGIAVLFIASYFGSGSSSKTGNSKKYTDAAADYAEETVNTKFKSSLTAGYDSADEPESDSCDSEDGEEWILDNTVPNSGDEETLPAASGDGTAYINIPITNLETSTTEENGTRIITLTGDENTAVIYVADEGTDLTSLYLEGFGITQTKVPEGVTDGGINYALYNTVDPDSSSYNVVTFAYAGNTYMVVLEKPVPEDNIREFITEY